MDDRIKMLLRLIENNDFCTAKTISISLNVSVKTVRNLIKECNTILEKNGAQIASKNGVGFYLIIFDEEKYNAFKSQKETDAFSVGNYDTFEKRKKHILNQLLTAKDYIKMDDLAEEMYVSRKTLTACLKDVEKEISKYNLALIRRPSYGIKIEGKEFDFRLCIANSILETSELETVVSIENNVSFEIVNEVVKQVLQSNHFNISDVAFENLVTHLLVAIHRLKNNNCIPALLDSENNYENTQEYKVANEIASNISNLFSFEFPEPEIEYIAVHLAGKKMINGNEQNNIIISQEIMDISIEMLEAVYDAFQLDFRDDLDLIVSLSQHIMPLMVRVKFDMVAKNYLLDEIKNKLYLAYTLATHASTVITEKYKKKLADEEIGFIAILFALAIERKKEKTEKKNILIVCASGKASTQMLVYKCKQEFGKYINEIVTCTEHELDKIDFNYIDYLFTTIPLKKPIPVPILVINNFLNKKDIGVMKELFVKKDKQLIIKYYSEDLFIPSLKAENKTDVIKQMCDYIYSKRKLPKGLYELVLKREKLAKTEFGNNVAMPHPYKTIGNETFVCVAVLEKPILWSDDATVQIVFLVCVEDRKNKDLQKFYQVTASLLSNSNAIYELIHERSYDVLKKQLAKIEQENFNEE